MNISNIKVETLKLIETVSKECEHPMINEKDFQVNIQLKGRKKDNSLPSNCIAVYLFFYGEHCLKIGQIGINSKARFQSHHYNPKSYKSNLANSILSDSAMCSVISGSDIKEWLKTNTDRLDVIIKSSGDKHLDKIVLNFIEGLLQYRLVK